MIKTNRIQKLVNFDSSASFVFASGNIGYANYDYTDGSYSISFHQGEYMPAYKHENFANIESLAIRMKELSGDLRKWQKAIREVS